ncbi:hypothetical protein KI387_020014, partial [Taxus chinensis]
MAQKCPNRPRNRRERKIVKSFTGSKREEVSGGANRAESGERKNLYAKHLGHLDKRREGTRNTGSAEPKRNRKLQHKGHVGTKDARDADSRGSESQSIKPH